MGIQLAEEDVRERAYALWEARGRPDGDANEDWFAAELHLQSELDAVSSPLEPLAQEVAEVLTDDAGPVSTRTVSRPSMTRT